MPGMKLLAILLLSATAVVSVVKGDCPDEDKIAPCFCQKDGGVIVATCSNIEQDRDLKNFVKNSYGYPYGKVIIKNSELPSLPKEIGDCETKAIELRSLKLEKFFSDIPRFSNVEEFVIESVEANDFSWSYFQFATNLKKLTMDHTKVPTITTDFNKYMNHEMKKLIFTNTGTNAIDRDALHDFQTLETLAIINNDLSELFRGSLPDPYNGNALYFQNNKLTQIDENVFTNMAGLKIVDMSKNSIIRFGEPSQKRTFDNLEKMDLSDNPIDCSCPLKWIPDYENKIFVGTCKSPKSLKGKNLNSLTDDDFSYCRK